jgi:uncharacterized membrane protein
MHKISFLDALAAFGVLLGTAIGIAFICVAAWP